MKLHYAKACGVSNGEKEARPSPAAVIGRKSGKSLKMQDYKDFPVDLLEYASQIVSVCNDVLGFEAIAH